MKYINEAYKQAIKAMKIDEVPVGAVIVKDGKIIARAYNKKECNNDPLGHCELLAIRKACKKLGTWRLSGCQMYVTLEPCIMCLGGIIHSRIDTVYYGAKDYRFGATKILNENKFNHSLDWVYLDEEKCGSILTEFFHNKRNKEN
jgi:tRNA(adenine34) deaminase